MVACRGSGFAGCKSRVRVLMLRVGKMILREFKLEFCNLNFSQLRHPCLTRDFPTTPATYNPQPASISHTLLEKVSYLDDKGVWVTLVGWWVIFFV